MLAFLALAFPIINTGYRLPHLLEYRVMVSEAIFLKLAPKCVAMATENIHKGMQITLRH